MVLHNGLAYFLVMMAVVVVKPVLSQGYLEERTISISGKWNKVIVDITQCVGVVFV